MKINWPGLGEFLIFLLVMALLLVGFYYILHA